MTASNKTNGLSPHVGRAPRRNEDPRLITGRARYIDDISLPGMLGAALVRSSEAHARIDSIDASAALARTDVHGVFTGQDMGDLQAPLPLAWAPPGVEIDNPDQITGRLARYGRGRMIEDISEQVLRQFAKRVQDALLEAPAEAANGGEHPRAGAPSTTTHDAPAETRARPPRPTAGSRHAAEPIEGVSLLTSALWNRVRRSPAPVAVIAALLLLLAIGRSLRR